MRIDFTLPPPELRPAFDSLESALAQDAQGDLARTLTRYLQEVEFEARRAQLCSTDFDERKLHTLLAESFASSQSVVAAAWQKLHGRELNF